MISACSFAQPDLPDTDNNLQATLASQGTQLAVLVTDATGQEQVERSWWDAIAYLSTQMPFALGIITPILTSDSTYSVGTYSEVVVCGFEDHCTGHTQAPFLVREGYVTTAVDICDWHAAVQQPSMP